MLFSEARKICLDYTVTGLETITALPRSSSTPFRFFYTSGANSERDSKVSEVAATLLDQAVNGIKK